MRETAGGPVPPLRADGKLGASDAALARAAFDTGCALAAGGDQAAAIAWLDRACRLAPHDRTFALTLASHCLATDAARAAGLFETVLETDDLREAWIGLASARLMLGASDRAAAAIQAALSRHALLPGTDALAARIAAAVGAAGWCGVRTGFRLIAGAPSGARIALMLDGRALPARAIAPDGLNLPQAARQARCLAVRIDGQTALGSPIDLSAIRRLAGVVACRDGGLAGWAWHPADPERQPVLRLTPAAGKALTIRPDGSSEDISAGGALARPRGFAVPAARLARLRPPFALAGPDGQALLGSPVDPRVTAGPNLSDGPIPSAPVGCVPRRRPVDVVIPVYAGFEATMACLDAVLSQKPRGMRVVVVNDASPDAALAAALDHLAARRRIALIRHHRNRGFPASANAGIRACAGRDVVLLNSDVLVPPGWLDRLRAAAYAAPDIGTVTPLTNDGSIVSYPGPAETNAVPDAARAMRLDALARRANGAALTDIPVGVGFCLYLRRDCLDATGPLREDAFAQGYGEEVDFCLRARRLGWRHVAATGLYVAHLGGRSFGAARHFLLARNQAVLNALHPGFEALVAAWAADGGLAAARRRLDAVRWRAARPRRAGGGVLLVTHDAGGGVERHIEARCATLAAGGERPIVLRPARTAAGAPAIRLSGGEPDAYPNLIYAMPTELRGLAAMLRAERPVRAELHHLLGHGPALPELLRLLRLPYDIAVHDYAWFCPRVALVGPHRRYCGEPDVSGCETCVAAAGRLDGQEGPVRALIDRSARLLAGARRVVAPSADAAARLRRHFPRIGPVVAPHEADAEVLRAVPPQAPAGRPFRIVTVGAIGVQKGFDVLLGCARDAAARCLPLEFVVVGHTIDDAALLATGRIFVTGEFAPHEATALIRAQRPTLGLLPSIWPETWSFALSDLWRAGLHVAAFDLGAQAERIRASGGRGTLLPFGLSAPAVNAALLAVAAGRGHQ
jgi:GT2 family glycosyltransferase/glycosyltransferase involved in cell wall biosynthesis